MVKCATDPRRVGLRRSAMTIAENLVRARVESGLGQEDVANALGVSRAMVSYWEAGSRVPNDRQLAVLSRLLRWPNAVLADAEELTPAPDVAAMLLRGGGQELPGDALPGLREFVEFLDAYAELADAAEFAIRGMRQSPFVSGAGFESGAARPKRFAPISGSGSARLVTSTPCVSCSG
jgi:transcriptional regulator with XRE-family HTH domain